MTTARSQGSRNAVFGALFVLVGASSIPWSAAIIQPAFKVIGPSASSSWRFLLGGLVLLVMTRPALKQWTKNQWIAAISLGVSAAFMNQCFYQAISRIPLGSAVVIEFLGPLLVAVLGKRTWLHALFVALAAFGIVALSRPGGGLTFEGAVFALGSGVGWAAYLFASHRVGGATTGFGGLAMAMLIAAGVTVPFTLTSSRSVLTHPYLLGRILLVAVMSLVIGFGAEMQALRRLKPSVVGVLLSFDPALAFLVGWFLLGERITPWVLVGLCSVVAASVGVTWNEARSVEVVPL